MNTAEMTHVDTMPKIAGVTLAAARVLVVGLGKSGLAAIELLRANGAIPVASDAKGLDALPQATQRAVQGIEFRLQSAEAAAAIDLIVLSPGVPPEIATLAAARAQGIPIVGEYELAGHFLAGPTIGITGTNGKTTTTALTYHLLTECRIAAQVGGNIGTPPSALVATSKKDQWNVLELSSFQTESMKEARCDIAVCLNVTPDHLDRYRSVEEYARAKEQLFLTQASDGVAVLNADDPTCVSFGSRARGQVVWFSASRRLPGGIWVESGRIWSGGQPVMNVEEIPMRGRHNWENVLAAAAVANLSGASLSQLAAAVRSFSGVEHRIEFVRTLNGVTYYNDSKATNVDAALKAIDSFSGRLFLILGGKDKGSDYTPLVAPLKPKAAAVLLIGDAARKIAAAFGSELPAVPCGDLKTAVEMAHREAKAGDTVLLAPACASFDQFDNYEHRGRYFKQLVAGLGANEEKS